MKQVGVPLESPSLLAQQGGFPVQDSDDHIFCFGVSNQQTLPNECLDGRLQRVAVPTANLQKMMKYYQDMLGFLFSDIVKLKRGV